MTNFKNVVLPSRAERDLALTLQKHAREIPREQIPELVGRLVSLLVTAAMHKPAPPAEQDKLLDSVDAAKSTAVPGTVCIACAAANPHMQACSRPDRARGEHGVRKVEVVTRPVVKTFADGLAERRPSNYDYLAVTAEPDAEQKQELRQ